MTRSTLREAWRAPKNEVKISFAMWKRLVEYSMADGSLRRRNAQFVIVHAFSWQGTDNGESSARSRLKL